MQQLYDKDQVFGFVGNVGTPTAAVALPFALDHRLLFFGAFTGASILRPIRPTVTSSTIERATPKKPTPSSAIWSS